MHKILKVTTVCILFILLNTTLVYHIRESHCLTCKKTDCEICQELQIMRENLGKTVILDTFDIQAIVTMTGMHSIRIIEVHGVTLVELCVRMDT